MSSNENDILKLREMVEESVSRKMKTPADFQFLTGVIQERCKETLGVSTLKRLWGYVDGYDTTRYSTLSILARCVGFRDWDDFCENRDCKGESSNMILSRAIYSDDLSVGECVTIIWAPDRRVRVEHLGNGGFEVLQSENSKLKTGDTFHTSCFIIGEPLYLDNFVRGNNPPTLFVVGNKGGLTEVRKG
ncbi:MAG: hypothetical protein K5846_10405 [Bacteroidales bacterium]|nr:hypothetical protein [Bacteroidales bacterium]